MTERSAAMTPLSLEALRIVVTVAELASFSRAADQLGLPKARVSVAVQQLEAQLGVRLLHRTTRRVRLTPDGEQFMESARLLLLEAEELQTRFQRQPGQLRGLLRVDLPIALARGVVIPQLPAFLQAHPQLQVALSTTDRRVDPVAEGFDCVLRVGALSDSGLIARPLGTLRQVNAVSPGYLAQHGRPDALADLARHRLVHYSQSLDAAPPSFDWCDAAGTVHRVPMAAALTVNSSDAYQAACLAGLGLIQAPEMGLRAMLMRGELVEVLPGHVPPPMPVSLLYPHRRGLSLRVQTFMDWLTALLAPRLAAPMVQ